MYERRDSILAQMEDPVVLQKLLPIQHSDGHNQPARIVPMTQGGEADESQVCKLAAVEKTICD